VYDKTLQDSITTAPYKTISITTPSVIAVQISNYSTPAINKIHY